MTRKFLLSSFGAFLLAFSGLAQAVVIDLFEYSFNIDGALSSPLGGDPVPAEVDLSLFDDITGLGTITVTIGGAGAHWLDVFVDHEIDEAINTFYNEYGAASGAPAAGQSWEIDEPEFVFGDIFTNFSNSLLDNSNGVPGGAADDVSMAMGWDFTLAAGETAVIDFMLSTLRPTSGFFLAQVDPDSNAVFYFSSALDIRGGGTPIPEPGTLWLLGTGVLGLGLIGLWKPTDN